MRYIVLCLLILAACTTEVVEVNPADKLAEERVTSLSQFQDSGRELLLETKSRGNCDDCWVYGYYFEYDSARLPGAIEIARVQVYVQFGEIINTVYEETLKNIDTFEECLTMGYEIRGNQTQVCITPEGKEIPRVYLCDDVCGDSTCQSFVCEGEGCPCAESAHTCPEDCS